MSYRIKHNCTICDSNKSNLFISPDIIEDDPSKLYGAASGIQGAQTLVKCIDCSMIYESPRFPAEIIIKGYEQSNEENHDSQHSMRVKSFLNSLTKNKKNLPAPGSKVLDIGTAGGGFLEAARKFGYDVFGLEPSPDLVERGLKRNLNIRQGTIENHNFEPHSFDLICLWDVIEHLPDPKQALIEIKKLLVPDGIILINYPDIGTWQAKIVGKKFWWIISVHLHHFTKKTISDICSKVGLQTFKFQRYWQTLEFGYLEYMAIHYNIPLAKTIRSLTPKFIQKIPIPYYASQTTVLVRLKK